MTGWHISDANSTELPSLLFSQTQKKGFLGVFIPTGILQVNVYISYRHIFANELIKQAAASPLAFTQELRLYEILASYYLKCSIDISLPDSRKAGGLQMAAELEDIQKEDQLTLSAACRWSNTAPASAHQWGCHRWNMTGTPPSSASHHLKGEMLVKVTPSWSLSVSASEWRVCP